MTERIERTALRNLIHNEEYSRKVLPFIKEDYFSDRLEKLLFKEIYKFITKFNALPTKEALSIEINDSKTITEDEYVITDVSINDLKIAHTTFLSDNKMAAYKALLKIEKLMNTLSVEEAQAATDPEVLSLYKLDLGDPIINHIEARIDVDVVFTNSVNNSTDNGTFTLRQNVYNETSDYISKVQALNPPGTMGAPGTGGFPDLPDGT